MNPISLGPYTITGLLGRGGMGSVYRATHVKQKIPVAIKVLTAKFAADDEYLDAFRNEVGAVAGLDHPNIVTVFDYGQIGADTAGQSGGLMVTGCPYLAMEVVEGGLYQWRGRLEWPQIRSIVMPLLDALAHAHARGVIHRDLKPGNVLVLPDLSRVALTDFGLAQAHDSKGAGSEGSVMGTPAYMAPEQLRGRWRDQGPWTDLYSFGCLVWTLVAGEAPYGRDNIEEVVRAQLLEPVPPLDAKMEVPEGLEGWFQRLMHKDPNRRFRWAADAAWALHALERTGETGAQDIPAHNIDDLLDGEGVIDDLIDDDSIDDDLLDDELLTDPSVTDLGFDLNADALNANLVLASAIEHRGPGIPRHWQRPRERPPIRLQGVGLGLYGLRLIPMVDRESERDRLWLALAQAVTQKRPHVLQIRGPAGCGKTRIAQWLRERAHELGVATSLEVSHSLTPKPKDGLGPMMIRFLGCTGMTQHETLDRVRTMLGGDQAPRGAADALVAAMFPEHYSRFESDQQRYTVIRRILEQAGRAKPIILTIDDAHLGKDALEFAAHLLGPTGAGPLPILIVAVLREEALAERQEERDVLERMLLLPDAQRMKVSHLRQEHRAELIREILGLEPALAARVEARTAGNPLFAVQLVGDWAVRGLLDPTDHGFELVHGAKVDLPDELHDVWLARVERTLQGRPASDGIALELAAVLGHKVDTSEWYQACALTGTEPSRDLVRLLLAQRLARTGHGGSRAHWDFAHGMLRESIQRRAKDAGRLQGHHRLAARMLAERPSKLHHNDERRARHLVAAGDADAALAPLLDAARMRALYGHYDKANKLLDRRRMVLTDLALPPSDERWGRNLLLRATIAEEREAFATMEVPCRGAEAISRAHGHDAVLAGALRMRARAARALGQPKEAWPLLEEGLTYAEDSRDIEQVAWCRRDLAVLHLDRGEVADAVELFRNATMGFTESDNPEGVGACHFGLARCARQELDPDRAIIHLRAAKEAFNQAGYRRGLADCEALRAELARLRGDTDAAETGVREAIRRYKELGLAPLTPQATLAWLLMAKGRYADAKQILSEHLSRALSDDRLGDATPLHALMLPCLAHEQEWRGFGHHLRRVEGLLHRTERVDPDIAEALERAGNLASEGAQPKRAKACLDLALAQWITMERDDETIRVDDAVRKLARQLPR